MKISITMVSILISGLQFLVANDSYGQGLQRETITLDVQNTSIREVFAMVESQTGFRFAYNPDNIRSYKVSIEQNSIDLIELLDVIFQGTSMHYEVVNDKILVYKHDLRPSIRPAPLIIRNDIFETLHFRRPVRDVSGTVQDVNGEPLIGVNIVVKGTNKGTTTDVDGHFHLSDVDEQAVLVLSYIGYQRQEISVGGQSDFTITMQEDIQTLDEVVVVGYGEQDKASVVAAITTMNAKGLKQTPASNLGIALAGRLPGLTVLQRSGVPGGEVMEFYIRGRSTVNGQQPLTLIDGVERDFQALDPREIESITVLKDASATAVYGVRGANGVIIVTTRRGEAGKPVIDISLEQAWQTPTRLPDMVSAYDYALLRNQVEAQNGRLPIFSDYELERYKLGDKQELYPTRDFVNEFLRNYSPLQKANVNVSGGTEKMRYFTNVGYLYQEGIFKTEKFSEYDYDPKSKANRVNFRSNFDIDLAENLSMFLNISGFMQKKNDPVIVPNNAAYLNDIAAYSVVLGSLFSTPSNYFNDVTPDGEVLTNSLKGGNINNVPYGMLNRTGFRNTQTNQVTATLGVKQNLDFILQGLSAKVVVSYDAYTSNQQVRQRTFQLYQAVEEADSVKYVPTGTNTNSPLSDAQYQTFNNLFNMDASLNYSRAFGRHNLTGMLLFNRYQRVINIELPFNYIGLVGRTTYNFDRKYLAEINFGYNGSEQFAPGHKIGFFPSLSVGWVLTEEDFMQGSNNWLDFVKLRASFGQVGNDKMNGDRFAFLTLWDGSYESQIGNTELQWEKANKYNFGIETHFLNSFSFDADIFYEKRNNILIDADGLVPTGVFGTGGVFVSGIIPKINSGVIENKGFEVSTGYQKYFGRDSYINIRVNGAFNRNKILYLSEVLLPEDYAYRLRSTGFRLGQPFGYETAGFFNDEQDFTDWYDQSELGAAPQLGDFKYKDQNGDGIINEKDMVPIGNPEIPEWTFGAGLSYQYKDFDISLMWQGVAGRSFLISGQRFWETYNFNEWHKEAWSEERYANGQKITYPRLEPGSTASKHPSDFWYVNGNYIRLKNTEIGYTFPDSVSDLIGASSIRLYANGLNLLTFDNYPVKYQDPEENSSLIYPIFKAYNFGINVSF